MLQSWTETRFLTKFFECTKLDDSANAEDLINLISIDDLDKTKWKVTSLPNFSSQDFLKEENHPQDMKTYLTFIPYVITYPVYSTFLNSTFTSPNFFFLLLNFDSSNINYFNNFSYKYSTFFSFTTENTEQSLIPSFNISPQTEHTSFVDEFYYLRRSTFIDFFVENKIDVPICFNKSKSLKRRTSELKILKFSNLLMRKGQREKIISLLFRNIRCLYKFFKQNNCKVISQNDDWIDNYFLISNFFLNLHKNDNGFKLFTYEYNCEENFKINYNNFLGSFGKLISTDFFIKNFLISILSKVSPIFSYFIYNVDKNIRKFSRGKSGKYTFVWKYVPTHKRLFLTMRWILKDIRFAQNKQFFDRLFKALSALSITPDKSFAWKSKIFSHNYVFKNFKKTLMTSLRATS